MGELTRKGESRPAIPNDLTLYERAQSTQALQEVPVLQRADNPHEYLFFALFDGTGQDVNNPEQLPTNIGVLKGQLDKLDDNPDNRVGYKYVEGIGTQANPVTRYADAWIPYTWDEKIGEAYRALAEQTRKWQQQDPEAQVRIAEVGYSRGAVLAAGLAHLVDKYGIADPEGLKFGRDAQGNITVESPHQPLLASGRVAQAMGLLDPVATNMPDNYDARRMPSVISATALAAKHEQRTAFPLQTILEPGLSQDRRFANLLVPGGHSNVGGGNTESGLETGSFNVLADYLNGLRDKPLFEYRPLPDDLAQYTVYQARGPTAVPGLDRDSMRDVRVDLANCKIVDPCRDGEPVNEELAAQFEYRTLQPSAPLPSLPRPLQHEAVQTTPATSSPPPTRSEAAPVPAPQAASPQTSAPQIPDHLRDFRHPEHPRHPGFLRFIDGLERVQAGYLQGSRLPENVRPEHFERIAAALTATQGTAPFFGEVGRVHQDKDGALWVSNLPPNLISEPPRWVKIDLADTLNQTSEAQAARWREQYVPPPARDMAQTQSVDPQQLAPTDLRHPDHPRHGMFAQTRGLLAIEYERWGLLRDPAQLDRETAQVVVEARKQRIDDVGGIALSFPQGSTRERPTVTLLESPTHEFANRTSVDGDKLGQAPQVDRAGTQLQQVEQQMALMQQQEMQQRQEREMAQGQGRTM